MLHDDNKTERILKMIGIIRAHPEGLKRSDIARILGVDLSTVSRYIRKEEDQYRTFKLDRVDNALKAGGESLPLAPAASRPTLPLLRGTGDGSVSAGVRKSVTAGSRLPRNAPRGGVATEARRHRGGRLHSLRAKAGHGRAYACAGGTGGNGEEVSDDMEVNRLFYAHTKEGTHENEWQLLSEHLANVAALASNFAGSFNAESWGRVAGQFHDLGKFNELFQDRIRGKNIMVDHSTAGAKYVETQIKNPPGAGRLIAYCIAGHHAGIPDGMSGDDDSCLMKRIDRCTDDFNSYGGKVEALSRPPFLQKAIRDKTSKNIGFSASFFVRMLYSCLVDADFLDTEAYIDPERASHRGRHIPLKNLKLLLDRHLDDLAAKAPNSEINKLRSQILSECRLSAEKEPGLFSLTVPTGGGKTLSSLAFAIEHALKYEFMRIIYVIPYTSIIEQTAGIFRSIFGDEAVLEHHSNIIIERDSVDEEAEENKRLASENWDASIVVTTNVQFFESFFANRSSKTRKLHNVSKSVVILDEAQMLPVPFLKPTIEIIRELAENYKTTIVLCTATQPALDIREDFQSGLAGVREIMSDPKYLEASLKRVKTHFLGPQSDATIVDRLVNEKRVLCIVNTKKHARLLYQNIGKMKNTFHLSAAMCPIHRKKVLRTIREKLKIDEDCRVVSTQLVEAGVDLDFPVVIRAMAGIDSIVQAAGRCNREGRIAEGGKLYVFEPEDGLPPGYLRQHAQIAELTIKGKENRLLASETVEAFFKELYWIKDVSGGLDIKNILERLRNGAVKGDFPFKTIASEYKIITDAQESIIIPYDDEAEKLCISLKRALLQGWSIGGILRKLQPYTIQIYKKPLDTLVETGFAEIVDERIYLLSALGRKEVYDEQFGLNPDIKEFLDVENLIT